MLASGLEAVMAAVAATLAFVVGYWLRGRPLPALLAELEQVRGRFEEQRVTASQLGQRCREAEELVSTLQRSIVEMPEVAQRLSAAQDVREIPECALDLVQEIFDPIYSMFYRHSRKGLVAVASRGECEFGLGHRVQRGEGVVGWTAMRQMAFTEEDAKLESSMVRERHLARALPEAGFSLCLPILDRESTLGVILIGPCRRKLPHEREIGRTIALMASVSITSAVVLREQRLMAKTDGLTGLANRTHLLRRVRELMISDNTGPQEVSLFLFDIDHFKQYNDTNGHVAGDELLKALAQLLRESIREGELVGRYGGEEFLLVMPDTGHACALHAAERIREMIAVHVFPFQEKQPGGNVTISGGVATWPKHGGELETLLRHADEALYEAKRRGRNRVLAFSAPELSDHDLDFDLPPDSELDLTGHEISED